MKYQVVRDPNLKPTHWRVDVRPGAGHTDAVSAYQLPFEFLRVTFHVSMYNLKPPTHASKMYRTESRARKVADLASLSGLTVHVTAMAMVEVLR